MPPMHTGDSFGTHPILRPCVQFISSKNGTVIRGIPSKIKIITIQYTHTHTHTHARARVVAGCVVAHVDSQLRNSGVV